MSGEGAGALKIVQLLLGHAGVFRLQHGGRAVHHLVAANIPGTSRDRKANKKRETRMSMSSPWQGRSKGRIFATKAILSCELGKGAYLIAPNSASAVSFWCGFGLFDPPAARVCCFTLCSASPQTSPASKIASARPDTCTRRKSAHQDALRIRSTTSRHERTTTGRSAPSRDCTCTAFGLGPPRLRPRARCPADRSRRTCQLQRGFPAKPRL